MSNRELRKKRRMLEESFEKVLYEMLNTTRIEFQNVLVGKSRIKYLESLDSLLNGKENMKIEDFIEKVKNREKEIDKTVFINLYNNDLYKWRNDIDIQDSEFISMLLIFISNI
jgi:hypothetical protein